MAEYATNGTKCSSCCLQVVSIPEEPQNRLKERVKMLEKTTVMLSERLHEQEKRTIALEKIIQGFAIGMNVGRDKSITRV